jgi:DNA polymerase-3 subunit delta
MVTLFLNSDEYLVSRRVAELKAALGDPDLVAVNTAELEGERTAAADLLAQASMMPFLAERRLIVARGLLDALEKRMAGRKGGAPDADDTAGNTAGNTAGDGPDAPAGEGAAFREAEILLTGLPSVPDTAELLLIDQKVDRRRGLWKGFTVKGGRGAADRTVPGLDALARAGSIKVETLATPAERDLGGWIAEHAHAHKLRIDGKAIALLAARVGPDLRRLTVELEKLSLYAGARPIAEADVRLLVADTAEEKIWNLTDALSKRNADAAVRSLADLWRDDQNPFGVLGAIANNYRLIIRAKTALPGSPDEVARKLGVKPGYPLQKAVEAAPRYSFAELDAIMERLLAANVAMVTGSDQRTEVDILVADLTVGTKPAKQAAARPGADAPPPPPWL